MKITWPAVLFIALNLFFIGWLAAIIFTLLNVLRGEDPLALFGILAADAAFLGAGIFLLTLNRYYPISPVNRVLPFIAVIGLTVVAIINVSDATLWFGIGLSALLIIASLATTIYTLIARAQARTP